MVLRIAGIAVLAFFFWTTRASSEFLLHRSNTELSNKQDKDDAPQFNRADRTVKIEIYVKRVDDGPIEVGAVVTLVGKTGQVLDQGVTVNGDIRFKTVAANEFTIQVAAPGDESATKD